MQITMDVVQIIDNVIQWPVLAIYCIRERTYIILFINIKNQLKIQNNNTVCFAVGNYFITYEFYIQFHL